MSAESEHKIFDVIFNGSESPMVIFKGPEMAVEMCNKKYNEIYHNRSILGQLIFEAVPELIDSPFPNILKKVYETGEPINTREESVNIINIRTGEKEKRYFDTAFSRISLNDKYFSILASPREVTERVLARQKLEESLLELQEERELRDRFVSALSHDLRNPLAIVTMCTLILKRKDSDIDTLNEMVDRITSSVARADRMIHNLLDVSRIKVGASIPLSIQEFKLDECVKRVITDLEELYGDRFKVENFAGEIKGFWDNMGIHRILENLVSNAVKYGTPYSLITVVLSSSLDAVEIQVKNEGDPILEDDQLFLFDQYSRSKSAEKNGLKGWGIGLALVKAIAEAHQGSVSVQSSKKEGTIFTIKLPRDSRRN